MKLTNLERHNMTEGSPRVFLFLGLPRGRFQSKYARMQGLLLRLEEFGAKGKWRASLPMLLTRVVVRPQGLELQGLLVVKQA